MQAQTQKISNQSIQLYVTVHHMWSDCTNSPVPDVHHDRMKLKKTHKTHSYEKQRWWLHTIIVQQRGISSPCTQRHERQLTVKAPQKKVSLTKHSIQSESQKNKRHPADRNKWKRRAQLIDY